MLFRSSPSQMPTSAQQAMASYEPTTNPLTGEPINHFAEGGITELAQGRMLKGPGDGVSDSIPATIEVISTPFFFSLVSKLGSSNLILAAIAPFST